MNATIRGSKIWKFLRRDRAIAARPGWQRHCTEKLSCSVDNLVTRVGVGAVSPGGQSVDGAGTLSQPLAHAAQWFDEPERVGLD
jgi:hypothetical protein